MSATKQAFYGCQIFDGVKRHTDSALLIDADQVVDIVAQKNIPDDYSKVKNLEVMAHIMDQRTIRLRGSVYSGKEIFEMIRDLLVHFV